jgi:hypothetical protein
MNLKGNKIALRDDHLYRIARLRESVGKKPHEA